jgi:hypothetical protein
MRRQMVRSLRNVPLLGPLRIEEIVDPQNGAGDSIENLQIIRPAEKNVSFGENENENKFLRISKYYREGFYSRPDIFVCEVPQALCHVGSGLVCTKDYQALMEPRMNYRLVNGFPFDTWVRPGRLRRKKGVFATISDGAWMWWWHWLLECLPRIYSLYKAYPGQQIVLLMPQNMGAAYRDSLASALPSNFEVQYLPERQWIKADCILYPSYVSGRCNGHLPSEHLDFLRQTVFSKFGLPSTHRPTERIYLSRRHTPHRRILNEDQLVEILRRYGFKALAPEKLTFREQVELFHRAEVIVSAHGSAWGNLLFSGKIKILALYPDTVPNTHVFTTAKALGQEHFFLPGTVPSMPPSAYPNCSSEYVDFSVDLAEVERVLKDEMGLEPSAPR